MNQTGALSNPLAAPNTAPVGLLAGWGRFPVLFAEKARNLNIPVVCVGVRNEAGPELIPLVKRFYWTGMGKLGRTIRCFRKEGVRQIVLAGKVHKLNLFRPWRLWYLMPDWRGICFLWRRSRRDNRDDTLTLSLMAELEAEGFRFTSALDICPELLVRNGILTRRAPSAREEEDIVFGWALAKEMGRLDVGQSVAVKEKAVLAVEAIEGTDKAILRAGELCRGNNFVVVKVAKPKQDMRFDVPTIGVSTIETMYRAGGRVLAVEAGKTIIIDEKDTVALADRYGITICAR
jgi:DUF1009 family protein